MKIHITITDEKGDTYEGVAELAKAKTRAQSHKQQVAKPLTRAKRKAPQVIFELYQNEFFKGEKGLDEVLKKLSGMRYNFERNTVRVALERADYLVNKGNRVYVEKYPPS